MRTRLAQVPIRLRGMALIVLAAVLVGMLGLSGPVERARAEPGSLVGGGFESPATGGYVYVPSGSGWSFAGNAGVQRNGSAFSGSTVAPEGLQSAFLQGAGSVGSMSQSVSLGGGSYSVGFQAARRWGSVQPVRVSVDGVAIGTYTPSDSVFAQVVTASFTVAAGAHVIGFAATDASGDRTTFIDAVAVSATGAPAPAPTTTTTGGAPVSAPPAPTGLTATPGDAQVLLTWAASPSATSYSVYRGTRPGGESATPVATGVTDTRWTSVGLANGTTYSFTVRATGAGGTSADSGEASAAPVAGVTGDIDLSGFRLTFADEFDALSVTKANPKAGATWYAYPPYGQAGNYSASTWTVDALSVANGSLVNRAYRSGGSWYSGNISSVDATGAGFSQRSGYFEARIRMPDSGTGSWPAFWLASTTGIAAVSPARVRTEEVDVVEWYGSTNSGGNASPLIQQASHNYAADGTENPPGSEYLYAPQTRMPGGALPWKGYHVYGVKVDPAHVTWYVDGVQTNRISTATPYMTGGLYLMLDHGLGGGYPLTGVVDGSSMLVDWVRVYALPD